KNANITGVESDYESNYKYQMKQSGLTVAVNIPALQALQSAISTVKSIKTVGQSKDDRINALAAANVAWDTLRTADSAMSAIGSTKALMNNDMANTNISVTLTYGKQKNVNSSHTSGDEIASSKINADKKAMIIATGDNEKSNINIKGSDISGNKGTILIADNNVNIEAQKQTHQERSTNQSSGFNAGVAISYGSNGFAAGFTAGGNYGKGYGNGDEVSWHNSHIGSLNSQTVISSQNDTRIKGAQVIGKSVQVNAQNLNIESLQDTMTYKGKQMNVSGQATVGYGASVSASYNQSKVNADYASVIEQSGIFAKDEGYQINVANNTDLKGAIITSTSKAEQDGKNHFSTATLTHSDIENHSDYSASGFGLSGGFSIKGDFTVPLGGKPESTDTTTQTEAITTTEKDNKTIYVIKGLGGQYLSSEQAGVEDMKKENGKATQLNGVAGVFSQGNWGVAKSLATGLLGQVHDNGSDQSVTSSFINTKNVLITDNDKQQKLTGKTTDETIQAVTQHNSHQALEKVDVEKIKSNMEQDLSVAQDFVNNLNQIGDKLYYEVEKNDKNILVKYKPENCDDPSCLRFFELDMEKVQNKEILTKEEAEILSRMYVHGIFNTTDEDRTEGGILYSGKDTLNNASIIVRKPYVGVAEEVTYTIFERLRAGANLPSLFGASNASRDQVTIWDKLNQYNQENANDKVNLTHVAHSLGVSSTKNAINWANYQHTNLKETKANLTALGTSYPIYSDIETGYFDSASGLFGKTRLDYAIAPQDCVGTCLLIGRTNSTAENTKVGVPLVDLLSHHISYVKDRDVLNFYNKKDREPDLQGIWNRDTNSENFGPEIKTLISK
ncbi:hemagglutinin repeat-containing protein, partial [Lonepinella sp. BR2357]|uniref:hemagglutinin repeat-containing protein n=1 Tax=Lonepinella sp. BR2357 TaxID=3434549 RepID=UPI003F6DA89F